MTHVRQSSRRVLLLHPFDAVAGSQRVAADLTRAFRGLGIASEVHLGFGGKGFVSKIDGVSRFLTLNNIMLRKVFYPFWIAAMIPRTLWMAWRGNVIWANTIHSIPAAIAALFLAPRRVILHIHEIEFPDLFMRVLCWAANRGAMVVAVSQLHAERLGVAAEVLPNCIDFSSDAKAEQPPIIVFVGAISPLKGFPLFVEVVRRLRPGAVRAIAWVPQIPPASLAVANDAREAGVNLRIGATDPVEMFSGATLTLQCTDSAIGTETFSLVMVESMGCGVPVATTGMAVAPEILGDAWAFDVPSRDPDLIAYEIMTLLDNPPRLQALRAAARARRSHFSFEAFQTRVGKLLDAAFEPDAVAK